MKQSVPMPAYAPKSFLLVACAMLAAPCAFAQGPATVAGPAPAYEVVSVKSSQPGCPGMSVGGSRGRFYARCITVWGLMYNAYEDLRSLHDEPPGLPGWASSAEFDVEAKMDDDTAAAMQESSNKQVEHVNSQMLQALLADRFKLRVHYETKIQAIDQLVVGKSGAKLKQWPAARKPRGTSWSSNRISIQGGGLDILVMCLSDVLRRKVVDTTGLTGNYDIKLTWTPDDQQGTPTGGPTLFTALEEQLGLKLKAAKGPVDSLVVDHVEKPSEN